MNWRKELYIYHKDRRQQEAGALQEIVDIKKQRELNARLLFWSVGPTLLSLPDQLHTDVTYRANFRPPDYILDGDTCLKNLTAVAVGEDRGSLIDLHTQYEPFVTVTAEWSDLNQKNHILRFGVIPWIEYHTTNKSNGWTPPHDIYDWYSAEYRVTLLSPSYGKISYDSTTPIPLQWRGCTVAERNTSRTQEEMTLAFPTATNFTIGEYHNVESAINQALPIIMPHTFHPDEFVPASQLIPLKTLDTIVDMLRSPSREKRQPQSIIPMLTG